MRTRLLYLVSAIPVAAVGVLGIRSQRRITSLDRQQRSLDENQTLDNPHLIMPKRELSDIQLIPRVHAGGLTKDFSRLCNQIMEVGFPGDACWFKCYEDFVIAYDTRTRNPSWVMELLTMKKHKPIDPEPEIDRSQARLAEHTLEGWENEISDLPEELKYGFLADPSNFKNERTVRQTFTWANAVLEYGNGLEKYQRELRKKLATRYSDMYICTGPMYMSRHKRGTVKNREIYYDLTGETNVAIPTHFFKIILGQDRNKRWNIEAYLWPNDKEDALASSVNDYKVSLETIEQSSGLLFFRKFKKSIWSINGKVQGWY